MHFNQSNPSDAYPYRCPRCKRWDKRNAMARGAFELSEAEAAEYLANTPKPAAE